MPALPPYIPTKEADFTNFLANFSDLISANTPSFGLLPSDAANIAALNSNWADNYTPVTSSAPSSITRRA